MRRLTKTATVLLLLGTAATGGAWLAWTGTPVLFLGNAAAATAQSAPADRPPLYFQDPDGKPSYTAGPKKTADGRDYVPVYEDAAPLQADATRKPSTPPAGKSGQGRVLYYRNPMVPTDTSPKPKKDPMGMDYLPVYENEAADASAGVVTVAPGRLQLLGVRTAPVETRAALNRTVRATGTMHFDERHLAVVTTKVGGWIEHLAVSATGDAVRRGQVLAQIYSPDLVASEQEYLVAAKLAGGGSSSLISASIDRLRALSVPDDEIARLRRTGKADRLIAVRALEDGVVIEKAAVDGMRVMPDQPLYKTASLSPMWLIAEVQEQDLGDIRPDETARASFVAFPGRTFEGTVDFIYPSLSSETRTGRVRILMPNSDLVLRAGMYANVEIEAPAGGAPGPVLVVPSSAIIDSGTQQVALVALGEGRFGPRKVRIGARGDGYARVLEGLKAGENVVTGANFLIDSESNLRSALQSFTAPESKEKSATAGSTPQ